MTITRKERPRDRLQLGQPIVDIATGQVGDREDDGKDAGATAVSARAAVRAEGLM